MQTAYDKTLLQQVKRLRLRSHRQVAADLLGAYRSRLKGQGLEYVESRAYEAGDDVRRMDWKVTARAGDPYVKIFQEERHLKLLLLVDVSNSMRFGGAIRTKLQTALSCAMALAYAAMRKQDVAQIVLFGEGVEKVLPTIARERDFWRVSAEVERLPLSPYTGRHDSRDFNQVLELAGNIRPRPQLVFLFSDFMPPDRFAIDAARWPRGVGLVPVWVRSTAEQGKGRLRLRLFDSERGHGAVLPSAKVAPPKLLGRPPIEIDDSEDLAAVLRRLVVWSASA